MSEWYKQQLLHPNWQKIRLQIMLRDSWTCLRCRCSDKTLNVHHKDYIKGRLPWNYPLNNFETLCYLCHQKEHAQEQYIDIASQEQRVIWRLVDRQEPEVITALNEQIQNLNSELKTQQDFSIIEDIIKNIMFLQEKKKQFLKL